MFAIKTYLGRVPGPIGEAVLGGLATKKPREEHAMYHRRRGSHFSRHNLALLHAFLNVMFLPELVVSVHSDPSHLCRIDAYIFVGMMLPVG